MSTQRKTVTWGKLGWKRVCKNTMRFGWESLENVEHTETTYTTNYEGEVIDDKVYIHEKRYLKNCIKCNKIRKIMPEKFFAKQSFI